MRKTFLIGIKDLKLILRDPTALSFMLLAPFLLTLGMGFITGQFGSGNSGGMDPIRVVIVNQDGEQLSDALEELFQSEDLSDLIQSSSADDPAVARSKVDEDEAAAAIIIPTGFTASIIPEDASAAPGEVVQIEVFKNPTRPVGAGVIQAIVEEFVSRVETGRIRGEVVITQMLAAGLITPEQVNSLVNEMASRQNGTADEEPAIRLSSTESGKEPQAFNPMAYMAPGMALMFLMFTVSNGGRSLLTERAGGTLSRLLVSPTKNAQVLVGKVFGIYMTGIAQMGILILVSSLIFELQWGDPVGLLVLILAAVMGATGWGLLITALARTPGQVSSIGTAIMLIFGILGGSFTNANILPVWFQWFSKITPNAWGMDGFTSLAMGGTLPDLVPAILGLVTMSVVLLGISLLLFRRHSIMQK